MYAHVATVLCTMLSRYMYTMEASILISELRVYCESMWTTWSPWLNYWYLLCTPTGGVYSLRRAVGQLSNFNNLLINAHPLSFLEVRCRKVGIFSQDYDVYHNIVCGH